VEEIIARCSIESWKTEGEVQVRPCLRRSAQEPNLIYFFVSCRVPGWPWSYEVDLNDFKIEVEHLCVDALESSLRLATHSHRIRACRFPLLCLRGLAGLGRSTRVLGSFYLAHTSSFDNWVFRAQSPGSFGVDAARCRGDTVYTRGQAYVYRDSEIENSQHASKR
jgi:hypothetical protein